LYKGASIHRRYIFIRKKIKYTMRRLKISTNTDKFGIKSGGKNKDTSTKHHNHNIGSQNTMVCLLFSFEKKTYSIRFFLLFCFIGEECS
jgi:hypothetical protein